MSLDEAYANAFTHEWLDAWNCRALDAILGHYAQDVVFHSPRIRIVTGRDVDTLRGKAALRDYWARAIAAAPTLHFTHRATFLSSDAITILYDNHREERVAETFVFNAGRLVQESVAAYTRGGLPATSPSVPSP